MDSVSRKNIKKSKKKDLKEQKRNEDLEMAKRP